MTTRRLTPAILSVFAMVAATSLAQTQGTPRPGPPTRDPNTPGFVTAKELPDGQVPPVNVEGNFIIGPTHTPSPETAVSELVRVLRPGGTLVVTCPNRFWHWSCRLANALGIRPYLGLENWPSWFSLRRWTEANGIEIREHIGLHLFPFVIKLTHPLLRTLDRAGSQLGPLYVNQCLVGIKRQNAKA